MVRRIDQFTATMVQPSAVPESVLFSASMPASSPPAHISIQAPEHTKIAVDGIWVQAALATLPAAAPKTALDNHGASGAAQNAGLSQHPIGRNFLGGHQDRVASASPGARHRPRSIAEEKPEAAPANGLSSRPQAR